MRKHSSGAPPPPSSGNEGISLGRLSPSLRPSSLQQQFEHDQQSSVFPPTSADYRDPLLPPHHPSSSSSSHMPSTSTSSPTRSSFLPPPPLSPSAASTSGGSGRKVFRDISLTEQDRQEGYDVDLLNAKPRGSGRPQQRLGGAISPSGSSSRHATEADLGGAAGLNRREFFTGTRPGSTSGENATGSGQMGTGTEPNMSSRLDTHSAPHGIGNNSFYENGVNGEKALLPSAMMGGMAFRGNDHSSSIPGTNPAKQNFLNGKEEDRSPYGVTDHDGKGDSNTHSPGSRTQKEKWYMRPIALAALLFFIVAAALAVGLGVGLSIRDRNADRRDGPTPLANGTASALDGDDNSLTSTTTGGTRTSMSTGTVIPSSSSSTTTTTIAIISTTTTSGTTASSSIPSSTTSATMNTSPLLESYSTLLLPSATSGNLPIPISNSSNAGGGEGPPPSSTSRSQGAAVSSSGSGTMAVDGSRRWRQRRRPLPIAEERERRGRNR